MRNIQLSQLKAESFCLETLVESVVEIEDLHDGYRNIKELLKDLDSLKEALFFKHEKIKNKLRCIREKVDFGKIDVLCTEIENIKLESPDTSRDILEGSRDLDELKLIQRVLRYYIEIDKGNFHVLDSLLDSENIEDWKFLAIFLSLALEYTENDNTETLIGYSRNIENKMIKTFQEACESNDKIMMKATYCTLLELSKEFSIIQIYIYSLDLFSKPPEILKSKASIIDLDFYDNENNTFSNMILEIRESYEKDFCHLANIFPNPEKIFSSINKKVFDGLIYLGLEKFLKDNSAGEYLLNLTRCYTDVKVLCGYIESLDNSFAIDDTIDELFGHYIDLAIDKEKDLFSEILNIMVIGGSVQNIKYIVNGDEVKLSSDYCKIYTTLISVIHGSLERAKMLYTKSGESELIEHFFVKIKDFLDVVTSSVEDKTEVIKTCSFIYLISRKYFKEKFDDLYELKAKLNQIIKSAYEYKLTEAEIAIKKKVKALNFSSAEEYKSITFAIEKELSSLKDARGGNFDVFLDKMLISTYDLLYKQILSIIYTELQVKNMKKFVKEINLYVGRLGRIDVAQKYNYLQDVANIISIDKNDFTFLYSTLIGKIEDKELIKILKCRKDKDDIMKKLYLN